MIMIIISSSSSRNSSVSILTGPNAVGLGFSSLPGHMFLYCTTFKTALGPISAVRHETLCPGVQGPGREFDLLLSATAKLIRHGGMPSLRHALTDSR